jgi:hypothetical protein
MLGVWFLPTFVINLYGIFSGPTHFGKKKKLACVCLRRTTGTEMVVGS